MDLHSDGHFSRRMVTHVLQQSTRGVPASWALSRRLFDLAPVGVCRAAHVTVSAVGSYPAFSPLPAMLRRRSVFCGTVRRAIERTPRSYLATLPNGARTFLGGITTPVATVRSVAQRQYSGSIESELPTPSVVCTIEQLALTCLECSDST